jgi:mitochondrial inner membrane protease subunit 2
LIAGISMQPALNPDSTITDYVFLSRWAVRNASVERGEIISFISPKDPEQKIIKRIVGLEGDVISTIGYKSPLIKVPVGHCWIEGDHTGLFEHYFLSLIHHEFISRQLIG